MGELGCMMTGLVSQGPSDMSDMDSQPLEEGRSRRTPRERAALRQQWPHSRDGNRGVELWRSSERFLLLVGDSRTRAGKQHGVPSSFPPPTQVAWEGAVRGEISPCLAAARFPSVESCPPGNQPTAAAQELRDQASPSGLYRSLPSRSQYPSVGSGSAGLCPCQSAFTGRGRWASPSRSSRTSRAWAVDSVKSENFWELGTFCCYFCGAGGRAQACVCRAGA